MRKLTYWVALCTDDSELYSIRAKTRRECEAQLEKARVGRARAGRYEPPKKVTVEYADAFDLMDQCSNEGTMSGRRSHTRRMNSTT